MYARSLSPREHSISQRIASNAAASSSRSVSLRWAYSGASVMAIDAQHSHTVACGVRAMTRSQGRVTNRSILGHVRSFWVVVYAQKTRIGASPAKRELLNRHSRTAAPSHNRYSRVRPPTRLHSRFGCRHRPRHRSRAARRPAGNLPVRWTAEPSARAPALTALGVSRSPRLHEPRDPQPRLEMNFLRSGVTGLLWRKERA